MVNIHAAVAVTRSYGIGNLGELPWVIAGTKFSKDLEYFRKVTNDTDDKSKRNAVIMGRRTWQSIKDKYRPLKNRLNIVLTKNTDELELPSGVLSATSIDDALNKISNNLHHYEYPIENAVVIGGVQLFEESILHPLCTQFHVTYIEAEYECDTFLSSKTIEKLQSLSPVSTSEKYEENGVTMKMCIYNPNI